MNLLGVISHYKKSPMDEYEAGLKSRLHIHLYTTTVHSSQVMIEKRLSQKSLLSNVDVIAEANAYVGD